MSFTLISEMPPLKKLFLFNFKFRGCNFLKDEVSHFFSPSDTTRNCDNNECFQTGFPDMLLIPLLWQLFGSALQTHTAQTNRAVI